MTSQLPIWLAVIAAAAAAIIFFGLRLTATADLLSVRTGLGAALFGGVFLGAATSLSGITASVTAALADRPSLALSNAFGGIAVQTAFLALADLRYPRANLEHAAASVTNMLQGTLLVTLLCLLLFISVSPPTTVAGVHVLTPVLLAGYVFGIRLIHSAQAEPMWIPLDTPETQSDARKRPIDESVPLLHLWLRFAVFAGGVVGAGWLLVQAVSRVGPAIGLSDTLAGALLIAVITSLPELVTSLAAVRRKALTLAVGGILGGNAFDTLFAALADLAYRGGSIYHAVLPADRSLLALTAVMTGVVLLGLLRRQRSGLANIGFESVLVLVLYIGGLIYCM